MDAHEKERDALGAGPLQCRQPVADLFDGRAEPGGELFQIVAGGLCCGKEIGIGHQCRPGEIIGQPDLGDSARLVRMKTGQIEGRLKQCILTHQCNLQQQLERLALMGRAGRDGESASHRIKAAQGVAVLETDGDAGIGQRRHGGDADVAVSAAGSGKMFGRTVNRVDVIVAIMEKVAHFLPG